MRWACSAGRGVLLWAVRCRARGHPVRGGRRAGGAALGSAQMQSFLLTLRCASSRHPTVTGTPRDARVRGAVQRRHRSVGTQAASIVTYVGTVLRSLVLSSAHHGIVSSYTRAAAICSPYRMEMDGDPIECGRAVAAPVVAALHLHSSGSSN